MEVPSSSAEVGHTSSLPEEEAETQILEAEETERLLSLSQHDLKKLNLPFPSSTGGITESTFRDRVLNVLKRSNSSTFDEWVSPSVDGQFLADKLWQRMISDLSAQHLKTTRMVQSHFRWLLPNAASTPQECSVYAGLNVHPMIISSFDLQQIIRLELSTADSPRLPSSSHNFYIRSWTFKPTELQRLIEFMVEENEIYEELEEWQKALEIHGTKSGPKYFTIRYIGTVEGPKTPWDRHQEDLTKRSNGIIHEFLQNLERVLPEIAAAAQIHLVKDASLDWSQSEYTRDDVERVLIQFFGHSSLLNRQRGGFYSSYVPAGADDNLFRDLQTHVYHRLKTHGTEGTHLVDSIAQHFTEIQVHANQNPHLTGTGLHPFTDRVRDMDIDQAIPEKQICNTTILLMIGKDITLEEYVGALPFLSGTSRAGMLTRDFIRRLAQTEADAHRLPWHDYKFNPGFPFVDLWPYLVHEDPDEARERLRRIVSIVKPLIAVSFGTSVTNITRGNFRHAHGIGRNGSSALLSGELTIQNYGESIDDDDSFINIPMIHPGADKYGSQDLSLRRLLDLTWQLTFLVTHHAIDAVETHKHDRHRLSRRELCEEILENLQLFKSGRIGQKFFKELQKTREVLQELWIRRSQRLWHSEGVQPVLSATGRRRIAEHGIAQGEPNSEERRVHALEFWNKNIPDLHLSIPHDDSRREEWISYLMPLQIGQPYFLRFLSMLGEDEFLRKLLAQCPETNKVHSWLENVQDRDQAVLQCGLWIHKKSSEDAKVPNSRHYPDHFVPAEHMQGRSIGIHPEKGQFTLHWAKPDGKQVALRFYCRWAVPNRGTQTRAVSFTEHGIDVVDSAGNSFRPPKTARGKSFRASIEKEAFETTEGGTVTTELWRAVREHLGQRFESASSTVDATSKWGAKGVAFVAGQARSEKPLQNRPPARGDANWLLLEFLDERFPDGGTLRTAPATRVLDSTDDLGAFIIFLQQSDYSDHPYASEWLAELTKDPPTVQLFEKNIIPYRRLEKSRTRRVCPHLGKNPSGNTVTVTETIFKIGPPDSADISAVYGGNLSKGKRKADTTSSFQEPSADVPRRVTRGTKRAAIQAPDYGEDIEEEEAESTMGSRRDKGKRRKREVETQELEDDPLEDNLEDIPLLKRRTNQPTQTSGTRSSPRKRSQAARGTGEDPQDPIDDDE